MSEQLSMGTHPDIIRLRERYETASETMAGQLIGGTTFLAGLYLAVSPWVVGFDGQRPLAVVDLVVGVGIALLGMGAAAAFDRMHRLAWTIPVLGICALAAPWVVRSGDLARTDNEWSNALAGAVLILAGLAACAMALSRGELGIDRGRRGRRI